MRAIVLVVLSLFTFSASAQTATTCKAQADEKKLGWGCPEELHDQMRAGRESSLRCLRKGEEAGRGRQDELHQKCVTDATGA